MSEAIFPLLGPLLVFAIVLPASAAVTRLILLAMDRLSTATDPHAHQAWRYVLLVGSSGIPLAWFFSASLHQAETGRSSSVCSVGHAADAFCPEAAFFALALIAFAALLAAPGLLREQLGFSSSRSPRAKLAAARVAAVIAQHGKLGSLSPRVAVRDDLPVPIATVGVLLPRVLVRTSFVEALDDEALAGGLFHELEHVRGMDPLRYFVVWWAIAVNPFGRSLLEKELARWLLTRELHCDRDAVLAGAGAPALAQAIVTAARPQLLRPIAPLGPVDAAALTLRVNLLLAYSERVPGRSRPQPALRFACVLLAAAAVMPHGGDTHALDFVHQTTERAAAALAGNR